MKIDTTRFGEVELSEEKIINFPYGIIGFEDKTKYVIIDFLTNSPLKWLQSAEEPSLAFVVCDPWYFFKDYQPKVKNEDIKELRVEEKDELVILSVVSVPTDISKTSLNLLSPIIINSTKLLGKQIILYNSMYNTKHFIFSVIKINSDKLEKLAKDKSKKNNKHQ